MLEAARRRASGVILNGKDATTGLRANRNDMDDIVGETMAMLDNLSLYSRRFHGEIGRVVSEMCVVVDVGGGRERQRVLMDIGRTSPESVIRE